MRCLDASVDDGTGHHYLLSAESRHALKLWLVNSIFGKT